MEDHYNYHIESVRFHLQKENTLIITGWFRENNPEKRKIEIYLDEQKVEYDLTIKEGIRIRQKYSVYNEDIKEEVICSLELPENWEQRKELRIYTVQNERSVLSKKFLVTVLRKCKEDLDCYIEQASISEGRLHISGWAIANEPLEIAVFAGKKKLDNADIKYNYRRDVMEVYEEAQPEYQAGFSIEADIIGNNSICVMFQTKRKTTTYKTSVWAMKRKKKNGLNDFQKFFIYWRKEGIRSTIGRMQVKLFRKNTALNYEKWLEKHQITEQELNEQRKEQFSYEPMFSFVIPLYKTNEQYLRQLLESIAAQTYSNWEICFADGSGREASLQEIIMEYQKKNWNIRYTLLDKNEGISENTNAAIRMATGDYIVLADHDDLIAPNALYECVKAVNQEKGIDVIYSDEDKVDMNGKKFFEPHFKPDYSIDLLCSVNYICHMFVVQKDMIEKVGMLRSEYDGAQDYDFIFRCCETAERIHHIPKVLYHWRCHKDSTAENPESKLYAFEAGRRAIEEHYRRIGIPAVVEHGEFRGIYHTKYKWEEQPLVSIIIPNKDHIEDLKKCMGSIEERSTYRNYEFIIVENNSTEDETFAFYEEVQQRENVRVVYYEGGFNYSKINNFGVEHAKGEYILLLNNDTEIINPDCIWELLGYCMREDVGIVGAKLCYEDDTIQHAGVVIGFGGMAGHAFIGSSRYEPGYMGRIICAQNYSAVTAACLMTKKSVYKMAGGLTEEFEVAFNDIDFCLKVRKLGKLVVYNPKAELYHYESKSRGLENTPEKVERFNGEADRLGKIWKELFQQGDPYYNPNLTLDKADFSLKV